MQRKTEQTTDSRSTMIRFWSDGNLARSAFDRIELLRSNDRSVEAKTILSEWILD